jgi:mycothiol synthase
MRQRPYVGAADDADIVGLMRAQPPAARHCIDLPWRLSSPAAETGRDVMVWVADDGTLVGFAAWQRYWATLDVFLHPAVDQEALAAAIFAWADAHFRVLDRERGRPLPYWVEYRDDDAARRDLVTAQGYTLDDDFSYVQLWRDLADPIPDLAPPADITLRPLADDEIAAYIALHRAAFESESMTEGWRAHTRQMPQHRPDLDLVAVAPDGALAGFCVGWLSLDGTTGQIEPLGVAPTYRGRRIGRVLLREMLRRFRAHGATHAIVETESDRLPAQHAYLDAGFQPHHTIIRKGRWATPKPTP